MPSRFSFGSLAPVSSGAGLLDLRRRSLIRGNLLVILALIAAFRISHFPQNHFSLWLGLPLALAILGTADSIRCMQRRWSWYHGGVVLCIYTDLMAVCLILFFLLYPVWL